MKKSLIALAAVAASGAAFAQSSVTLFGTVDTSVAYAKESVQGAKSKSKAGLGNDGLGSSALGFRGTEDLGNGLKAVFWLEAGVEPDVGAGATSGALSFNRRSTLGLQGGFGEVRFGRELTAGHHKPSSYSAFGTIGAAGFQGWNGEDVRYDNMVSYYSPDFAGFSFSANYAFSEKTNGQGFGGRYAGIQGTYANGPLSVTLAYDQGNKANAANNSGAVKAEQETWSLGASYDFGSFKLTGLYHARDTERRDLTALTSVKSSQDSYLIGAHIPVGAAGKVKVQYARYDGFSSGSDAWITRNDQGKANQFGLGYEHALSKRTAVYGTYAYLKNKNGSGLNTAQKLNTGTVAADSKIQALQVGVRHNF